MKVDRFVFKGGATKQVFLFVGALYCQPFGKQTGHERLEYSFGWWNNFLVYARSLIPMWMGRKADWRANGVWIGDAAVRFLSPLTHVNGANVRLTSLARRRRTREAGQKPLC